MNNSDNDIQPEDAPAEIQQPEAPVVEAPPPIDNRRRLRELLSVPERDRSDEQWDEIIELEIQMAPGNRIAGGEPVGNTTPSRQQPRQQRQGRTGSGGQQGGGNFAPSADNNAPGQQKKHRPRTKTNRRPRPGGKPDGGGTPA